MARHFALVPSLPPVPSTPTEQIFGALPLSALAFVCTVVGGLIVALLVGRYVTPNAEARKEAKVAASKEARAFASWIRNMASDVRLAKMYEDNARRGTDFDVNAAKARALLASFRTKYEDAAKLARNPETVKRSSKQEHIASLIVGLLMRFGSEQYPQIRDARNYFSQERPFAELRDDYLGDLVKLLDFGAKVFDPHKSVPLGLWRFERRLRKFLKPLYVVEALIVEQANLHRTALHIQQHGYPLPNPDEDDPKQP